MISDTHTNLIIEWFSKLEKGYAFPPYNPDDLKLLHELAEKYGLKEIGIKKDGPIINEEIELINEGFDSFDKLISKAFKRKIPDVVGDYSIIPGKLNIHPDDIEPFTTLFKIKPHMQVGYGEISIYWLFNYKPGSSNKAVDNRGGSSADLIINGLECEIKSYKPHDTKIVLGKFKDDKDSRILITKLFGALNLTSVLGGKNVFASEVTFNIETLKLAYEQLIILRNALNSEEINALLIDYPIFAQLQSEVNSLFIEGSEDDPIKLAINTMAILLTNKLNIKPGPGKYIINLLPSDPTDIECHQIPENIFSAIIEAGYDRIKATTSINSAEIQMSYKLFD